MCPDPRVARGELLRVGRGREPDVDPGAHRQHDPGDDTPEERVPQPRTQLLAAFLLLRPPLLLLLPLRASPHPLEELVRVRILQHPLVVFLPALLEIRPGVREHGGLTAGLAAGRAREHREHDGQHPIQPRTRRRDTASLPNAEVILDAKLSFGMCAGATTGGPLTRLRALPEIPRRTRRSRRGCTRLPARSPSAA